MLFQILFMIQAVRIMLLPYATAAAVLVAYDAAWAFATMANVVIPNFGDKIYA